MTRTYRLTVRSCLVVCLLGLAALAAPSPARAQLATGSQLGSGETLVAGEMLVSPNEQYGAVMQDDGNFVIYYLSSNDPLWSTATAGNPGAFAIMQDDGNFVVYTSAGTWLWSTATENNPGAVLSFQSDGNLVVYIGSQALWASDTLTPMGDILATGDWLEPNQYLQSPSGQYVLLNSGVQGTLWLFQTQGTMCPMWANPQMSQSLENDQITYTPAGVANSNLIMQDDGNLVLYAPDSGPATWSTGSSGSGSNNYLQLQDDGNLVVYTSSGAATWSASTNAFRGWQLCPGTTLSNNQWINTTRQPDGNYQGWLRMDSDCELELYSGKSWSTETSTADAGDKHSTLDSGVAASGGYDGCYVIMQDDGNFVMYAPNYPGGTAAMWSSGTAGNPGSLLVMQQGGCEECYANASIYNSDGTLVAGFPDDKSGISIGKESSNKATMIGKQLVTALLG